MTLTFLLPLDHNLPLLQPIQFQMVQYRCVQFWLWHWLLVKEHDAHTCQQNLLKIFIKFSVKVELIYSKLGFYKNPVLKKERKGGREGGKERGAGKKERAILEQKCNEQKFDLFFLNKVC